MTPRPSRGAGASPAAEATVGRLCRGSLSSAQGSWSQVPGGGELGEEGADVLFRDYARQFRSVNRVRLFWQNQRIVGQVLLYSVASKQLEAQELGGSPGVAADGLNGVGQAGRGCAIDRLAELYPPAAELDLQLLFPFVVDGVGVAVERDLAADELAVQECLDQKGHETVLFAR